MVRLSGEKRASRTQLECPVNDPTNFLLGRAQILSVLSSEAVRRRFPLREKLTLRTVDAWPLMTADFPCTFGIQRRTVRSDEADASSRPLGRE